jgi:hypothetical protein
MWESPWSTLCIVQLVKVWRENQSPGLKLKKPPPSFLHTCCFNVLRILSQTGIFENFLYISVISLGGNNIQMEARSDLFSTSLSLVLYLMLETSFKTKL